MLKPLQISIVCEPGAVAPSYQTEGSAGVDLHSFEAFTIAPMERRLVRTGVSIAIPEGYEGQVRPRSGLALRHGITMVNSPGTIDSDYRGELMIIMINLGADPVQFSVGDRIAQVVFTPVTRAEFILAEELGSTTRGTGGFGSTGS